MATTTSNCNNAHNECCNGQHVCVSPCRPVQNIKTKVVRSEGTAAIEGGRFINIGDAATINCTLQAGDGISIDEATATISAEPKDLLFEQADTLRSSRDVMFEDEEKQKILDLAKAMPTEIMMTLREDKKVSTGVSTGFMTTSPAGLFQNTRNHQQENDLANWEFVTFKASMLSNYSQYQICFHLDKFVDPRLLGFMERAIVASSPRYIVSNRYTSSSNSPMNLGPDRIQTKKAVDVPEEAALLVTRDYKSCMRLHGRMGVVPYMIHHSTRGFCIYAEDRAYCKDVGDDKDSLAASLMGRMYSDPINIHNQGSYGLCGSFNFYSSISIDAFFGCIPNSVVRSAYLDSGGDLMFFMYYTGEIKDFDSIRIPNFRVMLPKNEVIRNVRNAIDSGLIDEYGKQLTA